MFKPRSLFGAKEATAPSAMPGGVPAAVPAAVPAVVPAFAAGVRTPPAGHSPPFSERGLRAQIDELMASKQHARATRALIDSLPQIHGAGFNIKEKLSNLIFLTKKIQDGGGAKYGHAKLRAKIRSLTGFLKPYDLPQGGFVELGCGAHDPIGLSTFFYLNGFAPACGVDLLAPRVAEYSAASMNDILANMKLFPQRYCWRTTDPGDLQSRIDTIDVEKFEQGNFEAGLASMGGNVRFITDDLLECDLAPGSLALLTSFAVLEHVTDLRGVFARCYELLVPGGIAYHFIDLADHRSYRGDGAYGPFSFLFEQVAPDNMNRVRAPQFVAAALEAGFELLTDRRIAGELTDDDRGRLVSPFSEMALADVAVTKQHLVLRKPS
jgi:SAM-dependent methyltransferase